MYIATIVAIYAEWWYSIWYIYDTTVVRVRIEYGLEVLCIWHVYGYSTFDVYNCIIYVYIILYVRTIIEADNSRALSDTVHTIYNTCAFIHSSATSFSTCLVFVRALAIDKSNNSSTYYIARSA